jgi:hypothetical protein
VAALDARLRSGFDETDIGVFTDALPSVSVVCVACYWPPQPAS